MKSRLFSIALSLVLLVQLSLATNTVANLVPGNGVEKKISMVNSKALTKAEAKEIQKIERKQVRTQKRIGMVQKFMTKKMAKNAVDFQDPVNKWLWFGVFGWGAGLLLWIIAAAVVTGGGFLGGGFLGLLASLCWLFGTVAFVIWLVKKVGDA